MCGRFTLQSPSDILADLFGIDDVPDLLPRFNIAPTQNVLAVRDEPEEKAREFKLFRWGLIPFFAKDEKMGARMINARSETVAEKPSFRAAFKRRRCLVPADGYYEWKKEGDGKQPYHIHMEDHSVFAMAGLYERWKAPDGNKIESVTVITTTPNNDTKDIHDRMPVILDPRDWDLWLDPGCETRELVEPLLEPWRGKTLKSQAVTKRVNSPRHDDEGCIAPMEDQPGLFD